MPNRQIAALLPAYNEEPNIKAVIRETKTALPGALIVVVDDGSKDGTVKIAKAERVVLLQHKTNKGKGEALKTGLNYILKKNIAGVVIIDTDRQFEASEAPKVIEPILNGKADVVMGRRNLSGIPLRHRLGIWLWKTTFNLFFGTRLADTNCGFMALSNNAAGKVNIHGGYIIENSMLASAVKEKMRIAQVPVIVHYRKTSGVRRGIRIVLGVFSFIVIKGLKYRLGYD